MPARGGPQTAARAPERSAESSELSADGSVRVPSAQPPAAAQLLERGREAHGARRGFLLPCPSSPRGDGCWGAPIGALCSPPGPLVPAPECECVRHRPAGRSVQGRSPPPPKEVTQALEAAPSKNPTSGF